MRASKSSHSMLAQHPPCSLASCSVLFCFNILALLLHSLLQVSPHSLHLLPYRKQFQCCPSSGCEELLTNENSFGGHTAEDNWIWYHRLSKCTQANISRFLLSYIRKPKIEAIIRVENLRPRPREQVTPPTLTECTTFCGQYAFLLIGYSGCAQ